VSDFVSLATQRGKASGALSDSVITPPTYMLSDGAKNKYFTDIAQSQFSRLKNALRAREVLANMFSEIADNPNRTVDDLVNTDIDKPQQAIDSIKRLNGYIDSIVDQMNSMDIQARKEREEIKKMEKSQERVREMLDSLTSGLENPTDAELELEQDLERTMEATDYAIRETQSALDNQYGPLLEMRKRMLEAVSGSQGFSRNSKKVRTKGANAPSIKQLVNAQ
jgi:Xaa-Pro aminopeptidase